MTVETISHDWGFPEVTLDTSDEVALSVSSPNIVTRGGLPTAIVADMKVADLLEQVLEQLKIMTTLLTEIKET